MVLFMDLVKAEIDSDGRLIITFATKPGTFIPPEMSFDVGKKYDINLRKIG